MLSKAISLTAQRFEGVTDKGGNPYILHCLYVMNHVDQTDEELMCAAVMHDLVEDTDITLVDLYKMGFSFRTCNAIESVTKKDDETYDAFIDRCSKNIDGIKIKLADLRHNSDITRLKGLRDKDFARLEKYARAYNFLVTIKSK